MLVLFEGYTDEASSQITGVVTARGGISLEGVSVEVWTLDVRIAASLTDSSGRFIFPESIAFQAVTMQVGALGFRTQKIFVEDGKNQMGHDEDPYEVTKPEIILSNL